MSGHPPDLAPRNFTVSPCPYCGGEIRLVTGREVYPHRRDLWDLPFWMCPDCNAWCGCHPGTNKPLGTLANAELRKARSKVHDAMDPLWKGKGYNLRSATYKRLRLAMGISKNDCHIGKFDLEQAARALEIVKGWAKH